MKEGSLIMLVTILILVIILEALGGKSNVYSGKVLNTSFRLASISYGNGVAINSNGQVYSTVNTNYIPEDRVVIVHHEGEILNVDCDRILFHYINKGDKVKYKIRRGLFTNMIWYSEVVSTL